jgi:hypothetical protein
MNKLSLFFSLLISVVLITSCKKDPMPTDGKGSLNLNFQAYIGDELMVMNKEVTYNNTYPMRISRFSFFISDITLVGAGGETKVLDIASVDFTNVNDETAAAAGKTISIADIASGDYTAIKIGIGVSSELNRMEPSDFDPGHPLAKSGDYWDGWQSYIFSKTEGLMNVDGGADFERGLAYHTGSDEVYRTNTLTHTIKINANAATDLPLKVDLLKIFDGIDLSSDDGTHLLGDLELATIIMDNFAGDGIVVK